MAYLFIFVEAHLTNVHASRLLQVVYWRVNDLDVVLFVSCTNVGLQHTQFSWQVV